MSESCDDPGCEVCRPGSQRPLSPYMQLLVLGVSGGDQAAQDSLTGSVQRAMAAADDAQDAET